MGRPWTQGQPKSARPLAAERPRQVQRQIRSHRSPPRRGAGQDLAGEILVNSNLKARKANNQTQPRSEQPTERVFNLFPPQKRLVALNLSTTPNRDHILCAILNIAVPLAP